MTPAADDFAAIAAAGRVIAVAEGPLGLLAATACGSELDIVAARCGVDRKPYEADDGLRTRVLAALEQPP